MARLLFIILALIVLIAIVLIALGVIDVTQTREARAPTGGQAPAYDVDINPVEVGTERRNVTVPVPRIGRGAEDEAAPAEGAAESAQ